MKINNSLLYAIYAMGVNKLPVTQISQEQIKLDSTDHNMVCELQNTVGNRHKDSIFIAAYPM